MPQTLQLQDRFLLILSAAGGASPIYSMPEQQAVHVPGRHIVPFIKVYTSADNHWVPSSGSNGLEFSFQTAAVLLTPSESSSTGARFVDCGSEAVITIPRADNYNGAGSAGKTYTADQLGAGSGGGFKAIENPGGLMVWTCSNTNTSFDARLWIDIYLICHEG